MSKRMLAACGLVLALVAVPAAQAQVTIDMSKVTCEQYLGYKIINPNDIAMWLSGYYSAHRDNTIIDTPHPTLSPQAAGRGSETLPVLMDFQLGPCTPSPRSSRGEGGVRGSFFDP